MKQLTLLFLVKDNQILLAMKKRGHGVGHWNGVGGKLDANETVEQALVRECQEEIEVTPTSYKKMAVITFHLQKQGILGTSQVHVFICSKWKGNPSETEEMSPKWFSTESIPYNEMWADDSYWLPKVLEGQKLKAEFELDQNNKVHRYSIVEVSHL